MKKTNPLLAIGAGLMTFGMIYNYRNGDYAWASIQFKLLIGYFIVLCLWVRNAKNKRKFTR